MKWLPLDQLMFYLVRFVCSAGRRDRLPPEVGTLRILIIVVGLVLIVTLTIIGGVADNVAGILKGRWLLP